VVREDVLSSRFFDKHLPGHVSLLRWGRYVLSPGGVEPAGRIVVDPCTPPLFGHGYHVVPIECVHLVGEVKSNLTCLGR